MKRLLGIAAMVAGGALCALILFVLDSGWRSDQAAAAIEARYGPVEMTMSRASRSHCPWGSMTHIFLAQGPRSGGEVDGYVCTSWWRKAVVMNGPLDPQDSWIDWH